MTTTTSAPVSQRHRRRLSPAGTVVGVDIGCHSLKIVQLEAGSGHRRPRVCRIVPHANPLDPSQPEECLAEIGRTLQRTWSSRNRWFPLPAACTLSISLMTFRTVEVPAAANEAVSREQLQQAFLADLDAGTVAWMVDGWPTHSESASRNSRNFALLGVREDFATGVAAQLWNCGLDCRILDGLPFAMARATASLATAEPVAVIDWGHSAMTFTVVVNGRPGFTRILRDCELRVLTTAMMRPLELDADQCRQLLEAYGLCQSASSTDVNSMTSVLAEISAPYLNHLDEELRRTWAFLQQLPGQTPKSAVLMGGGAALKMSAEITQSALPVPIDVWSLGTGSPTPGPNSSPAATFAPAWSLARLLTTR